MLTCARGAAGDVEGIERMIEQGANLDTAIDPHGAKCLHIAAGHPNPYCGAKILQKLIDAGRIPSGVVNFRCAMSGAHIGNATARRELELSDQRRVAARLVPS